MHHSLLRLELVRVHLWVIRKSGRVSGYSQTYDGPQSAAVSLVAAHNIRSDPDIKNTHHGMPHTLAGVPQLRLVEVVPM